MSSDAERQRINLAWLLRLRWGTIAGQIVTILVVDRVLEIPVPMTPLLALVGLELASNVAGAVWLRRGLAVTERTLGLVMALDVLILTGLLFFSGGANNPFSFLYLVHIALAAVVLGSRWTWGLVVLSVVCSGALLFDTLWGGGDPHAHHQSMGQMRVHLEGMWVAFGVAAAFIVYFLARVTGSLRAREEELARARMLASRGEKLASLATLAAGAAHELSTPLSTIAVVSRELERQLGDGHDDAVADARLIRREVDRCQEILRLMSSEAGESAGESFAEVSLQSLLDEAVGGLADQARLTLHVSDEARACRLYVPRRATAQAVRGVLKNAQQATEPAGHVDLEAVVLPGALRIEVNDSGRGMAPDVLARAGEPFFTTKEPGQGMGLGLFLSRAVIERLGGRMELSSEAGRGTRAVIEVPLREPATIGRMESVTLAQAR